MPKRRDLKKPYTEWTAVAVTILIVVGLVLWVRPTQPTKAVKVEPASVERITGTDLKRITITSEAAQRLDIQVTQIREESVASDGTPRRTIPYAAVIYDPSGATWTYTSPGRLSFVRQRITIEAVRGGVATLSSGPLAGTSVVTVGAAELYGIETGIGK